MANTLFNCPLGVVSGVHMALWEVGPLRGVSSFLWRPQDVRCCDHMTASSPVYLQNGGGLSLDNAPEKLFVLSNINPILFFVWNLSLLGSIDHLVMIFFCSKAILAKKINKILKDLETVSGPATIRMSTLGISTY